jgi:hypothetical protein
MNRTSNQGVSARLVAGVFVGAFVSAVTAAGCGSVNSPTTADQKVRTSASGGYASPTTGSSRSQPPANGEVKDVSTNLSPCAVLTPKDAETLIPEAAVHQQTSAEGVVLPGECRYVAEVGTLNFEFYGGPPSYHHRPADAQCALAWERMNTARELFKREPPPNEAYEVESVPGLGSHGIAAFEKGTGSMATVVWRQADVCAELTFSAAASGAGQAPQNSTMTTLARHLSSKL